MSDNHRNRRYDMDLSPEQFSQMASDRYLPNAGQITDQRLGIRIDILPHPNVQAAAAVQRPHRIRFILRLLGTDNQALYEFYWPYIRDQIINYHNQYNRQLYNHHVIYTVAAVLGYFNTDRDAQAEGRTSIPTDSGFQFSVTVEVVAEDITFGIADTQPHDANMLTRLRNNQPTYFIINDHNGHSNQDATLYNYDDNRNVGLMLQTGANAIVNNNGDSPAAADDNLMVNINPLSSTQCQDGILAHNTNQMQMQSTVPENNARRQEQDHASTNNVNINNNNDAKSNNPIQKSGAHAAARQQNEAIERRENVATPIFEPQQTVDGATCVVRMLN